MVWWFMLAVITGTLKQKFIDGGMPRLNKISGAIITASGAAVLAVVAYHAL